MCHKGFTQRRKESKDAKKLFADLQMFTDNYHPLTAIPPPAKNKKPANTLVLSGYSNYLKIV